MMKISGLKAFIIYFFIAVLALIVIPRILRKNCAVAGCKRNPVVSSNYCSEHECIYDGCHNLRISGNKYCQIHFDKIWAEIHSNQNYVNSISSYKKKNYPSRSSSSSTKSYKSKVYPKSKTFDSYDVNDYDDPYSFAEDKYEEFYDYEDDYEDEDEAYDAAVDYWNDNYDDDDDDEDY